MNNSATIAAMDPRYYKGVEYADIVEALARRRCAECFATDRYDASRIFVNVQPLSGAPANNAVYEALVKPGDVVMGMSLIAGGHLTHPDSVERDRRTAGGDAAFLRSAGSTDRQRR